MVRLTNSQYLNTVQDLFPSVTLPAVSLAPENVVDGYTSAASGQTPTALLVEDFQEAAEAITTAVGGKIPTLLGCQPTSTADEDSCVQRFISDFGKRAYRRPVSSGEATRLFAFYKTVRAKDDFPTSVTEVIQLVLQSPSFLYRMESGSGAQSGGLVPLTSYEVATRLSYFLTDSMPDAELMQAADQDALQTPDAVEAQARRLLASPRAHVAVAKVNYQWLKMSKLEGLTKDSAAFATFTPALAASLRDSVQQFVEHAFWDEDSLTALLSDVHAYVNDAIAPLYGVSPPGSSALQLVELDPTQRAGLLTQAGMLAMLASPLNDSPVQRGLLVLSSFLCSTPPPPPAGVNTTPPPLDPSTPTTTRQRLQTSHAVGGCASCHTGMDDIGFAFENYDALGQWRTTENGIAVDASSKLSGTDVDGSFTGAIELANRLSQSNQVTACVSYQWLRYALGLDTTQINVAAAQTVADEFSTAGRAFSQLLVSIARSEYFRSLRVSN